MRVCRVIGLHHAGDAGQNSPNHATLAEDQSRKVRASLDAVCPKCGGLIPPADVRRIDFGAYRVPGVRRAIYAPSSRVLVARHLGSRTDQHGLLRAAAAVVVYRNMRRPRALCERLKRNLDEAASPRSHALTACIGFGKVPSIDAGDRNARDAHCDAAFISQRDTLRQTLGANRLVAEVHLGWNKLHKSSSARQRKCCWLWFRRWFP
jgi:hypothetical protein